MRLLPTVLDDEFLLLLVLRQNLMQRFGSCARQLRAISRLSIGLNLVFLTLVPLLPVGTSILFRMLVDLILLQQNVVHGDGRCSKQF